MANIVNELSEQAQGLIDNGNSKEQAEGYGMMRAIEELGKYYHGFQAYDEYFDSIDDEEKPKLNEKLKNFKIY